MRVLKKNAFAVIEYVVLFVIIIGAFLIMRNNIQHGVNGLWGQAGQSFAFGRQFDSQKTIECSFDAQSSVWYDYNCFQIKMGQHACNGGDTVCEEGIISSCNASSYCSQLNS